MTRFHLPKVRVLTRILDPHNQPATQSACWPIDRLTWSWAVRLIELIISLSDPPTLTLIKLTSLLTSLFFRIFKYEKNPKKIPKKFLKYLKNSEKKREFLVKEKTEKKKKKRDWQPRHSLNSVEFEFSIFLKFFKWVLFIYLSLIFILFWLSYIF